MLNSLGRTVDAMLPDGNCLFRSLSKALFAVPSGHLTLRNLIVGFIESNPRQLGGLCNGSVNDHCQDIRISGHFGTQAELQAASSLFQIPIKFFFKPSGTRGWEWMVYRPQPKDTLNLRSTVFLRLNAAAFNRQGYCSAAAFIRGRRLIEGGVY